MFILLNTDITLYKGGWLFYICICQGHPYPLADKNLLASLLNMYSNSCVGFPAVASHLHIAKPLLVTTDSSEVMFTSLFSGNGKFETLLVWRAKSSFFFLFSCRNAFQFGEIFHLSLLLCPYLSSLWSNP